MARVPIAFVVCLAALSTATALADVPSLPRHYQIHRVPMDGWDSIGLRGMNDFGQVLGIRRMNVTSEFEGFLWSKERGLTVLGPYQQPRSINNHGVVVGESWQPGHGMTHTFRWSGGDFEILPLKDMVSINDAGQIAGRAIGRIGEVNRPVILNPDGTIRALSLPPNTKDAHVGAITAAGAVTGSIYFGDSIYHGAIWNPAGDYEFLPGLPAAPDHASVGQKGAGDLTVGSGFVWWGNPPELVQRAAYWDADHQVHDLGLLPGAIFSGTSSVNVRDEIVGWSSGLGDPSLRRAFLWTAEEGMLDLNDLVEDPGDHWEISMAYRITDSGYISVGGRYDGQQAVGILEPRFRIELDPKVPEPGCLVVLAGVATVLLRRRVGYRR